MTSQADDKLTSDAKAIEKKRQEEKRQKAIEEENKVKHFFLFKMHLPEKVHFECFSHALMVQKWVQCYFINILSSTILPSIVLTLLCFDNY
jgi:hypothetical protein